MSAGHSRIAPSSGARRLQCPASTTMEERFPEAEPSEESAEGEASHWAGAELLQGRLPDVGDVAPNGVRLTQEMLEGADLYYADVVKTLGPSPRVFVEQPVRIPRVHVESWGTPDCYAWTGAIQSPSQAPLTLYLWDYKFGHRVVEVYENRQCIEYVAGLLPPDVNDRTIRVVVTIVQPRSFHKDGPIRRWSFMASEIRAHINQQAHAAAEALGPDPRARVGPECRDCRARHACPTLQAAALDACDIAGKAQPLVPSLDALGVELRMLKRAEGLLKARIAGLEAEAIQHFKSGRSIPHFRIEHGNGRRRWAKPNAEVFALGDMLGVNLRAESEPITPTQAVKAGLPEVLLTEFAERPRAAATLVEDDGSTARRIFGATT